MNALPYMLPEIILLIAAAVLFVLGTSVKPSIKRLTPVIAVFALIGAFFASIVVDAGTGVVKDSVLVTNFSLYIKAISCAVATLFVLLAWPTSKAGDGNDSINFSTETGEYFALLLLAVAGMCVTASANSLPTLFLGIELASIPTYIMVTMSRPHLVAQEAGVKYFFLGAASAAIMLMGMSFLFGVTGEMQLTTIAASIGHHSGLASGGLASTGLASPLLLLAVVLIVVSFLFKLAAAPLHFYAGDVYQGAATPVTAAISFIPKVTGTVALLKILYVAGGGVWAFDPKLAQLIWIIAILTMTVGNILGLLQYNVKRVLAYSSIAHSGYILVGISTAMLVTSPEYRTQALAGVAFYLLAYGVMNTAAFGVLMLLPSKIRATATTAETYDDIAGAGRKHPLLGLAMAVSCFSLIGMPATIGFFGKLYIVKPAIQSGQPILIWLAVATMINATISAAYYLKIVAAMWSRTSADENVEQQAEPAPQSLPVLAAVTLSVVGILAIGIILPLTGGLFAETKRVVQLLLG